MIDPVTIAGISALLQIPSAIYSLKNILADKKKDKSLKKDLREIFDVALDNVEKIRQDLIEFTEGIDIINSWKQLHDLMTKFKNDGRNIYDLAARSATPSRFEDACLDYYNERKEKCTDFILKEERGFFLENASIPSMSTFVRSSQIDHVEKLEYSNAENLPWWEYIDKLIEGIHQHSINSKYEELHEAITSLELYINQLLTIANNTILQTVSQINSTSRELRGKLSTKEESNA